MNSRFVVLFVLFICLGAASVGAQTVTRSSFRVLEDVQALIEEEGYEEAISMLEELAIDTRQIPYDYAIANQYLAHTSVMMDRPDRAREALANALQMEGLPPALISDLQLFYGTVLLGDDEYAAAAEALDVWMGLAVAPSAKQLFTVAYANYMSGSLEKAETVMARVFGMQQTGPISDTWYQVYYRILFDLKKYEAGEKLLLEMLSRNPGDEQHWRLLASHYMQLEQSNEALASLMIAYWTELADETIDLKRIVSLYGFVDVPEKAARLLETWLEEEKIPKDEESFKQLGNLWILARERGKAKSALESAASAGQDSTVLLLLGGIYFEDEDWVSAHGAYIRALRLEELDERDRVSLLAGISAYRAGMTEEARAALEDAAMSDEYRDQAESILSNLDEA